MRQPSYIIAFSSKVFHQIFKGIAQNIIATGTVFTKIEDRFYKNGYQLGQAVNHFLTLPEFFIIVEVGYINDAHMVVGFCQCPYYGVYNPNESVPLIPDESVPLVRQNGYFGDTYPRFGDIDYP